MTRAPALAALALSFAASAAHAQSSPQIGMLDPNKPVYVTSHIDVTPAFIDRTAAALKAYVEAARREPGVVRVDAVQETRTNHFDLLEVWKDLAAFEAHAASPGSVRLHDAIFPWRGSPFEERLANSITP
jgi:quinol monooxygenase YgiN